MERPRRFSFSLRQQHDIPRKARSQVTTIGNPIDALPLHTETQPTTMERREVICVSPTWKKDSKPRARSQSVPPRMGEGRQTSRRLVKKQPPVKQQHSRRESSTSSDNNNDNNNNNTRFGLISSISTRIRSRRPSISRSTTTPDGNLPALHGPRQSDQLNDIPAPRVSATLPPGFGATITRDLKQGPVPVLTPSPHPRGQERQEGQMNGYTVNHPGVDDNRHTLRRAGAPIHHPLSDEASHFQSSNAANRPQPDSSNARPIKSHSDRKDITIPDSLRIGRTKKLEPGPKSPKRARPKTNNNLPNYGLPKTDPQKQEQAQTCKDSQQKNSRAGQNTVSQSPGGQNSASQNTGNQITASISTSTSPQDPIAKPSEAPWPLPFKTGPEKEETTSNPEENKKPTPKPNTTKRLSPQQPLIIPRDSVATNDSSTLVADSPAVSNPPAADTLPKTTDTPSATPNSAATISPRAPLVAATQPKDKILRNTMSPRQDKYLAKIFVVCCQCNFWHDIPSALYAKMIIPEHLSFSEKQPGSTAAEKRLSGQARDSGIVRNAAANNQSAHSQRNSTEVPDNTVQCCWCSHAMAKACCTGWTTMVHLLEKHH
ncbi:uncharacterized protein TRUGW13939_02082 [Talaromyces rugulosus]|uniref:Uncharacterized protein n=1 Tax=Talaromyces rugulosus TaxID=121627 RepID=A0A7H8QME7_TALRU|nr:uncharacterized protein TRUGW13939_02082 [Talaromyces rugulosus]QKX54992.1 hypothetical protein TRUGW13939_02082 [Talaromyces rugulosus]